MDALLLDEEMTMFELILKGGVVGGLIILLSCVALGSGDRLCDHDPARKASPQEDIATFKDLVEKQDFKRVKEVAKAKPTFLSDVLTAGLDEINLGYPAMIKAMEDTAEARTAKQARRIEHLNVIGNISPMMGLLGTVIGMLRCFNEISQVSGSIDPKQLAAGIFEALVTTCLGLIVAIPDPVFLRHLPQSPGRTRRRGLGRGRADHCVLQAGRQPEGELIVRAFRKREWASFVVNMTPLIDVVFLIIIFFIMIMSFYEFLPKNVILPSADEAKTNAELTECSITVTAEEYVIMGNQKVAVSDLEQIIRAMFPDPRGHTVELRGDQDAPFDILQKVMQQVAQAGISRIHFATRKPYKREMRDEGSDKSDG